MFSHMNAAMPLLPQQQFCIEFTPFPCQYYWQSRCYYYWPSQHACGWYYISIITCVARTTQTIIEQQACLPGTQPPAGQVPSGDPVEQLQALRRQLEVAMAGLEAQERVLRAQQDASRAQGAAPEKK